MKLGMRVGLGPGQMAAWIKMPLDMEVGLGPDERGTAASPTSEIYGSRLYLRPSLRPYNPRLMSIVAKRLDGSRSCHLFYDDDDDDLVHR